MSLTILVTGASSGLGLEFVKQFSEAGHTVIGTLRNPDQASELQELASKNKVHTVKMDVVDEESVKVAAEEVAKIAPNGIDILINNAGIMSSRDLNAINTTAKEYVRMFETNVSGTVTVTLAFLDQLRKRNTRKIINISSGLGSLALPKPYGSGASSYSVSKAAQNMFSKMLAIELEKEDFTVVPLHPGWVQTRLGTAKAPLTPAQSIAGMIKVINKVTAKQTGVFFDYEGNELPW
ncbi:hypothetical protein EC973_000565 [Apophysomyces ossiformis]|uniref:Uncharacterized protein n=1 Tax=Apophysomyces ossiformis TaxID=679940 RepID=A0A8H7BQH0_9FUNG|nr:hypothetical protein EC973_000565 [Apophysomyces ossiformis]